MSVTVWWYTYVYYSNWVCAVSAVRCNTVLVAVNRRTLRLTQAQELQVAIVNSITAYVRNNTHTDRVRNLGS